MRSFRVDTDRLGMQVYESGPEDGVPVVLIHGNLSTGRFYEHLFDTAPERYRLIAPDMRGFGETESVPIDATRGLRDWADDTAALLRALEVSAPPHLVGWSTGGAAIAAFALDRPVASLTFIDPVGPYGFGAVKLDGTPHYSDFAGSGGGTGNPEFTARLAAGDTSSEGDTAPRNVLNSSYWRSDYRDEREDMLLGEVLKSVTGDDGYPGDMTPSEHWPGVAPGTRGILNALSPKYCNWSAIVDLDPKPPILWTHGTADIVIADGSPWEMGTLGSLGVVPGWPGQDVFPPQPIVTQIRNVLSEYEARGGRVQMTMYEGSGHFPALDARERWEAEFFTFLGVGVIPGLFVAEHEFSVALAPGSVDRITVFAREIADPEGREKPWLVYLQGGPGHESPRPTGNPRGPGWLDRALQDYRVLLLDQRGTGRSTPVSGQESVEYLTHFRADNIIRDCEAIREALGSPPWSVLGQSYGGLCALTYLSLAPEGLKEALITGGVPGIGVPVDDVYRATWERMLERNRRYYARYPQDRERMLALAESERIRSLGHVLGMSDGYERLHYILELPPDSPAFREHTRDPLELRRNPIYGLLHEACWADGEVTNWSAQRTRPEMPPEYFTGEHILPGMFDGDTAEALAQHPWPRLYDPQVLEANEVPVAATIYTEDLYVERRFAEQTAAMLPNFHAWVTSEYDHNGLRVDGERILGRLIDLVRGRI